MRFTAWDPSSSEFVNFERDLLISFSKATARWP